MDTNMAAPVAPNEKKIAFIGAGKAGCSFGRYIIEGRDSRLRGNDKKTRNDNEKSAVIPAKAGISATYTIAGYYSKTKSSTEFAAEFTSSGAFESLADLLRAADIIFITTPDGQIESVGKELVQISRSENIPLMGKLIGHLSGCLSSEVLKDAAEEGALTFSLHPACAIPSKDKAWVALKSTLLTFEGGTCSRVEIAPLLDILGNKIGNIDVKYKTLYHAACVILSNFSVGLAKEGTDLLVRSGLEPDFAGEFLKTLFLGNAENIAALGPVAALTGPAERADAGTINGHLKTLADFGDETDIELYKSLTEILIRVAKEKNPERNYSEVTNCISQFIVSTIITQN
jgi:predicted short-subunit dehydrogenase-like oxidoreductase (DUF2520 family)